MAPAWLDKFIVRTDATPDARRTTDTPVLLIHYTALAAHRRILGVEGDTIPRYQVDRHATLGAWGNECSITAPAQGGKDIAVLDFHTLPSNYTAISLVQRGRDPALDAFGGLGRLHWKDTGMQAYGAASWELRDERDMVLAVSVDGAQANGEIGLWRAGLDEETVEELVVLGIARIEAYKNMLREAKVAAARATGNAAWLAAAAAAGSA